MCLRKVFKLFEIWKSEWANQFEYWHLFKIKIWTIHYL